MKNAIYLMLFNLIIKKDNGNPIDTSIVVPVREVA
jgi:hypothetical protein